MNLGKIRRLVPILFCFVLAPSGLAETPLVAIASDMSHALKEIAAKYHETTGKEVNLSFGSSGNFSRQILQGAPYTIFLSAGRQYVNMLANKDFLQGEPLPYTLGRIGFFIPRASPFYNSSAIDEIINNLYYGDYSRIAIVNPNYSPYGVAAEQALQNSGLWAISRERLLIAENTTQVVQYVLSGGLDLGIIPASFAQLSMITGNGKFLPVPESRHDPIEHYLMLIRGAGKDSMDFFNYLAGEEARKVLGRYGYTILEHELNEIQGKARFSIIRQV